MGPILPTSKKAPTMNAKRIKKAFGIINRKYTELAKKIKARVAQIPTKATNESKSFIFVDNTLHVIIANQVWDITGQEYENLTSDIEDIVTQILNEGGKRNLFAYDLIETEAKQATTLSYQNLASQSEYYATRTSLFNLFTTEAFTTMLSLAKTSSYYDWQSLGQNTTKDLANVIQQGIANGISSREMARVITKRLGVSRSNARRIAQTELLGIYRKSRIAESERAETQLGIINKLLWISALMPTTRHWHGNRHGKYYTREEVKKFYEQPGNIFNCYCSQVETLIDENGEPVISKVAQKKLNKERELWSKMAA